QAPFLPGMRRTAEPHTAADRQHQKGLTMLAVSERITERGGVTTELIWHKPVGPDPDATFQRIACSDTDGIVMSGG
ncbi:hypothetical protein KBZ21_36215, partial [Streptomyces sp. A73]|nr:hypothetical protein [Streptomyces sp. A73]